MSGRKEIKIREVNDIENRKATEKNQQTKIPFFEKINKINQAKKKEKRHK